MIIYKACAKKFRQLPLQNIKYCSQTDSEMMFSQIMSKRPQSATTRQQIELINKAQRAATNTTDVVEKLRLLCISRGARGLLGLSK